MDEAIGEIRAIPIRGMGEVRAGDDICGKILEVLPEGYVDR